MSMDNKEIGPGSAMTPRLIIGLAIALFGVVLVLDRLNLVIADQVLRWWPMVIVAVGALIFSQSRRVGGGINGVIVMIIGGWLLLNSVGILRVRFWEMFWPLVLIGIGSMLVLQTLRRRTSEVSGADRDNTLNVFAALSGVKRVVTATNFRGGEITALMGGAQLDLRQAVIPPGEEAALDFFSSWAAVRSSCRRPGRFRRRSCRSWEGSTTNDCRRCQVATPSVAGRLRAWCYGG